MSIQPHSLPSNDIYIFSIYQESKSLSINTVSHIATKKAFDKRGIKYKELTGSYNGVEEKSFMLEGSQVVHEIVTELCKVYNQECYLYLDKIGNQGVRKAHFVFSNSEEKVFQGYFRDRPKQIAKDTGEYTYDMSTDTYYIIESDYTQAVSLR